MDQPRPPLCLEQTAKGEEDEGPPPASAPKGRSMPDPVRRSRDRLLCLSELLLLLLIKGVAATKVRATPGSSAAFTSWGGQGKASKPGQFFYFYLPRPAYQEIDM